MTERRTGWRKAVAVAGLTCALLIPATTASAQPTPTRPAATATPARVGASPAAGEPMDTITPVAIVLGVMVVGGLTLRRFAERRA